jgi:protein SCO1/2
MNGLLRVILVALVLLVATMMFLPRRAVPPPSGATELPQPVELPAVTFTDELGQPFTTADLGGEFSLVFFGFTNCPDICPLSMQVLAAAHARLAERGAQFPPRVVLVSVDPDRDDAERLRAYVTAFDATFKGITAPAAQLAPLLQKLGVVVMRHEHEGGSYSMTHNPQVFVMSPAGQVIAIMSKAEDAETVATDFLRIRQRFINGTIGQRVTG